MLSTSSTEHWKVSVLQTKKSPIIFIKRGNILKPLPFLNALSSNQRKFRNLTLHGVPLQPYSPKPLLRKISEKKKLFQKVSLSPVATVRSFSSAGIIGRKIVITLLAKRLARYKINVILDAENAQKSKKTP